MTTTATTYRKPWTGGAKAYPEADDLAGVAASMYRRRNRYLLHVRNSTPEIGKRLCPTCGLRLDAPQGYSKPDEFSTWHIDPKARTAVAQHYVCSWQTLFNQIAAIHL